ncbi:MAG: helix-turn-helix domain-containing protein, partial [Chloroflexota bacterium]|nr:helix-turn-helix domain-containing protein [Chloroflexota bacterium]
MDTGQQQTFGALLKRQRLAAGLSQEQLAERAGLTAQAISVLERGTRRAPYRDTVRALARALGLAGAEAAALEEAIIRVRTPASSSPSPTAPP